MSISETEGVPIELAGVSKRYSTRAGRTIALENVDISVRPNEFLALLGPSGCGKSTLLKLVSGLEEVSGGTIRIDGDLVTGPRADVGFCFQRDNLLEWRKVIDNVLLPAEIKGKVTEEMRQRAESLLEQVGLQGYGQHFPHQLSGGMRQRTSLCRALLLNATMMLMDEPFGALDALSRERHQILLQEVWMRNRRTLLFVTHDIREAVFLADRIVLMSPQPGRISSVTTINLPRPRIPETFETVEFQSYVSGLHRELFAYEWGGA